MSTDAAISIDGLEKVYAGSGRKQPSVHALKPLQLSIAPGEIFGLLGPNGAGKTTLVKLLLGIAFPTSGRATLFGNPIGTTESKRLIGYLPENHRYPNYLDGGGVLEYFGRLSEVPAPSLRSRSKELLELVNMTKWKHTKIKKYSKGMMQRIGIAQALLNHPRIVFLDEPTDGVDPVGRKEIRDLIVRLRDEGMTVFLNSHLLSEVERICDRVAILRRGEIARIGTVDALTETSRRYRISVEGDRSDELARLLAPYSLIDLHGSDAELQLDDIATLNNAIDALRTAGILITSVAPMRQTLEELFIDVVTEEEPTA